jgi:hypothetical protein
MSLLLLLAEQTGGGGGGGGAAAYAAQVVADGATVYYRLNDSAAPAVPYSGLGINAAATGTPAFGATGAVTGDTAVDFASNTAGANYLQTATTTAGSGYDLTDGPFTIEQVIQFSSLTVQQTWLGKSTGAYLMRLNASGKIVLRKSGTGDCFVSTNSIPDTNWHHCPTGSRHTAYPVCRWNGLGRNLHRADLREHYYRSFSRC